MATQVAAAMEKGAKKKKNGTSLSGLPIKQLQFGIVTGQEIENKVLFFSGCFPHSFVLLGLGVSECCLHDAFAGRAPLRFCREILQEIRMWEKGREASRGAC